MLFSRQNICHAADNFVCASDIHGGTWILFQNTMSPMGIECRFVDPADPENFRKASDAKTRCWYGETLPNPKLAVFPIADIAKICRAMGIPLSGQNRLSVAVQADRTRRGHRHDSTTKCIGGQAPPLAAIIVERRSIFHWESSPSASSMLFTPDLCYYGAVWTQAVKPLGPIAYIIKARVTLLRDIGAAMSPFNAFMFIQGLETVALRMLKHSPTRPPTRTTSEASQGDQGARPWLAEREFKAAQTVAHGRPGEPRRL